MWSNYNYTIISVIKDDTNKEGIIEKQLDSTSTYRDIPFVVNEKGTLTFNGVTLRINDPQEVFPGVEIWLKSVVPILQKSVKTKTMCMNCLLWDRPEGRRLLAEPTHKYSNAVFSRVEQIQRAVSTLVDASPLTDTNVGFCPKLKGQLRAETAATCEHYQPRGLMARFFNWRKRIFR